MKNLVLSLLVLLVGSASMAQEWNQTSEADSVVVEQQAGKDLWVCYFAGKQSFGGPVGDIWQTVRGEGPTQLEAINDAQNRCFSMGLNSCMMRDCHKWQ